MKHKIFRLAVFFLSVFTFFAVRSSSAQESSIPLSDEEKADVIKEITIDGLLSSPVTSPGLQMVFESTEEAEKIKVSVGGFRGTTSGMSNLQQHFSLVTSFVPNFQHYHN